MKDKYVKKLVEEITRLENKANSLQEKVYEERRKASDEGYKRYLLENLIKEHNKRSWWGRAEKIELKKRSENGLENNRFPGIPMEDLECT